MSTYILTSNGELYHYGIKGMKWGRRKARPVAVGNGRGSAEKSHDTVDEAARRKARKAKMKKAVKVGAAVAGTALAAYGSYKVSKALKNKAYSVAHARGTRAASKFIKGYTSKNTGSDAIRKASNVGKYLSDTNHDYAVRSSRTTAAAVKTLLGKNYEMPVAELWNMGINTVRL